MMTAAGVTEVPLYRINKMKLGDAEAMNVTAAALADSAESLTCRKARGFLGLSFQVQ
ncbi:MAG: hypothetical protein EHM61_15160 [Acidobacteria bacterium]|nr:MAG: hypothetical protein EHM61_15160 [Acidobacteriota bacterium]